MTAPRRRVLRAPAASALQNDRNAELLRKQTARLEREQAGQRRWMTRLIRAFHAVEKHQRRIARLQRVLHLLRQV